MGKHENSVVLISGGARGLGEADARKVIEDGGKVVIGDILDTEGKALAEELAPNAVYVHLDVTKQEDWSNAVKVALDTFGKITGLVNNAGIAMFETVESLSEENFDKIMNINVKSVLFGMQAVIPAMRENGKGSIVNISSTAGMVGYPSLIPYVASKWAVRGMSKSAALDLVGDNIRVNSVHPGSTLTPMTEAFLEAPDPFAGIPMGRFGEPADIGNMVSFLLSDEAKYITGQEFVVDGGVVAQ